SENIVLVLSTVPNGTCTEEKTLHLLQIVVLLWNWSWRIRPGERWQPKCNRRTVLKPTPAKPLERPAINGGTSKPAELEHPLPPERRILLCYRCSVHARGAAHLRPQHPNSRSAWKAVGSETRMQGTGDAGGDRKSVV